MSVALGGVGLPPRLFVFDWDGTLIDSIGHIVDCLRASAVDTGLPDLGDAGFAEIIGLGLPEAIARLYPGIGSELAEQYRARYVEHFLRGSEAPPRFFPHAVEVLLELRARGHLIAVATGKSRRGLDRVLAHLNMDGFFDATRCSDETASKPDPRMLHEICAHLAVDVAQAVMVGDTEFDLEMARRAGLHGVGVSYGSHPPARLARHAPAAIIDSLRELLHFTPPAPVSPSGAGIR